ncbi:ABC transporter permease [Stenotrophomonas sp.]|uniref:ABC transporter permease n=1 Tax=Stenotrophomonas sp. TaxID=69392 RepID=UPI002D578528|nr:ABC transporter permease [Stenotrophomonas sp.]HYQ22609.1 ABC transporter permease [Stenotrophomonas sp.]
MNTVTRSLAAPRAPLRAALRPYFAELQAELRRAWRTPAFAVPSLLFPVLFYLLFGVLLGRGHAPLYLLATYCVFGAMAPALFGFGVQLALDREGGLLTLKRALPMPAAAPLLARLAMAVLFALLVAGLLVTVACTFGGVQLQAQQILQLMAVAALAALPLGAIGLLIGSHASASAAPAMVNLVYLPLALLSGLWLPLSALPKLFSTMAPLWPTWHLAQLALPVVGLPAAGSLAGHLLVLLGVTVVALLLARRRLRRVG